MKYIFTISVITLLLTSCSSINNYMKEQASKPRYEKQYTRITGMASKYPIEAANIICSAQAKPKAIAAYQDSISGIPGNSGYNCTKSYSGRSADCEAKKIGAYEASLLKNNAARASGAVYQATLEACMANNGYHLQDVCIKNCPLR